MKELLFSFIESYLPLKEEEKKVIVDLDVFEFHKKGTILLNEGKYSNKSYFVLKGCIRTFYTIEGIEKATEFYTEMEGIVPPSLTLGTASEFSIDCVEDCILSTSNPEMEGAIFERFPRFETLCRVISEELLAKNKSSFDNFKTSTPQQRYENLLTTRPELTQRVPQHQLASYLGITPQSMSRIRKRMSKKKESPNKANLLP